MRLKRLIIRGFKSFADRTEFDFDADLIGIVGPNGCGKSNVVDALKWVLGDRSAKSLRGSEMTDVIFKGAEGREPMDAAEVTLVLENDRVLSSDGAEVAALLGGRTEVSIGRRLTREKESSYLINGEVVRLKDVRDLLMDTGLGVGAYSVMEQGRIDAVLSAEPESRRAIFEEAAGISKFKLQKKESLRKLERTEQNLARVKDLLEERSRRIRSLKIQAGKARRWQELRDQVRDFRSAVAVQDARTFRARQQELEADLREREERLQVAVQALDEARSGLGELEERIGDADRALQDAQDRLREATSRRDLAQQRASSAEDRAEEQREAAEACTARVTTLDTQRRERRDSLDSARARLVEVEAQLVELGKAADERREAASKAQAEVRELQQRREDARNAMLELLHERTRLRNLAHEQTASLRGVDARMRRVVERSGTVETEIGARGQELGESARIVEALGQRIAGLDAEEERIGAPLDAADTKAGELARLEAGLRERVASTSSRLELLQGMEAHHEGLDQGPKFLLEQMPPGLRGRLLDMIDCDLEYSRALEAALGEYVQALVVDTRRDAEVLLALLADEGKGRATLLIAEEFGDRLERSSLFSLPEGSEFLYRKVRCRPDAWPMVQWLLRGVCIVDSFEDARTERTDLCFVTREGGLLCGPRVSGGAAEEGGRAGLVVRRAQIRSLEEETQSLEANLEALRTDRSDAQGRADALRERVAELARERQSSRERFQAGQAERRRLAERFADLEREQTELVAEGRELSRQRAGAVGKLGDHLLSEFLVRRAESRAQSAESEVATALTEARRVSEEAVSGEQDVRVRQAATRTDRDALVERIDAADATLRDLGEAMEDLEARREQALSGAERAADEARRNRELAEETVAQIEEYESVRDEAAETLTSARLSKQERQDTIQERDAQREELRESIGATRIQISDVEHRFDRLEEKLRSETDVELRRLLGEISGHGIVPHELAGPPAPSGSVACLEGPPIPPAMLEAELSLKRLWEDEDFDLDGVRKEVQVIQSQIDRLGSIHVDAVRELEEEEQKLGTREHDFAELPASRKALLEALRKRE
ncbi:MAG: chromosome segregation protein SMC, partial [Planctomycetota bacterium]